MTMPKRGHILYIFPFKFIDPTTPDTYNNYACIRHPILPVDLFDDEYYKTSEKSYFEVDPKYADNITWGSMVKHQIKHMKKTTPRILEKRNLLINNTKTEYYNITRNVDDKWKLCKLFGSLIDAEKDINRRKILSIDAYRSIKNIFKNRNNNIKIKLKA